VTITNTTIRNKTRSLLRKNPRKHNISTSRRHAQTHAIGNQNITRSQSLKSIPARRLVETLTMPTTSHMLLQVRP